MKLPLTEKRKTVEEQVWEMEDVRISFGGCLAGYNFRYPIGDNKQAVGYTRLESRG